jgi:hypothetical protein
MMLNILKQLYETRWATIRNSDNGLLIRADIFVQNGVGWGIFCKADKPV